MSLKKIYFLVPLTTVVVFTAVYLPHRRNYEQRVAAQRQKERAAREEMTKDPWAVLEQRARERAEGERPEDAQRVERAHAERRHAELLARENRLRAELQRMCQELEVERVTAALLEHKNKPLFEQPGVLAAFKQQAEANRKALLELIENSQRP